MAFTVLIINVYSIHILAGDSVKSKANLQAFDDFLGTRSSFVNKHRAPDGVFSSIIDDNGSTGVSSQYIEHDKRASKKNPFFSKPSSP